MHSDLYLGNDSGMFHMAAAVGTPQVVVFGVIKREGRAYESTIGVQDLKPCAANCGMYCARSNFCMDNVPWQLVYEKAIVKLQKLGFRVG